MTRDDVSVLPFLVAGNALIAVTRDDDVTVLPFLYANLACNSSADTYRPHRCVTLHSLV